MTPTPSPSTGERVRDPVCGMEVDPASAAAQSVLDGKIYYFCSTGCKSKFEQDAAAAKSSTCCCHPAASTAEVKESAARPGAASAPEPAGAPARPPSAGAAPYYCPMCPGVESDQPAACPHCGMALELNPVRRAPLVYTCPMHPEIVRSAPGTCPLCGMALELKGGQGAAHA